jgi:hypothetical protein
MTEFFVVAALVVAPVAVWLTIGGDVLRVGYASDTPSPTEPAPAPSARPIRNLGVIQIVMIDHADPTLALVVVRIDGGGHRIVAVRTDNQGVGTSRLQRWAAHSRRVRMTEKKGAGDVVFRPTSRGPTRATYQRKDSLHREQGSHLGDTRRDVQL